MSLRMITSHGHCLGRERKKRQTEQSSEGGRQERDGKTTRWCSRGMENSQGACALRDACRGAVAGQDVGEVNGVVDDDDDVSRSPADATAGTASVLRPTSRRRRESACGVNAVVHFPASSARRLEAGRSLGGEPPRSPSKGAARKTPCA